MITWSITVSLLLVLYVVLALVVRPQVALGIVVPLSWLIPAWTKIDFGIEMLDVKTAVTVVALVLYSFMPKATFPWRFVPADYAVLGIVAVHLLSDYWNSGPQIWSLAFAYVEWAVPYLAGRLAFQRREDIQWIWPSVAGVAIVLGGVAIFEALSGFNPYEIVFGERPFEGVPRNAMRWGFRRAYGICLHPLYNGVLLCWLSGWLLYPAWRSLNRLSHNLWLLVAGIGLCAPIATGSRGPFLAVSIVFLASAFCYFAKWRLRMTILTLALGFGSAIFQEPIFNAFDHWSGETTQGRQLKKIELNDEVERFSSARARLTLFKIFWTPLTRAGLLGYGTESVSTFPPNVPTGSDEVEAMRDIWSVDNTYILLTLRFGYLGLLSFLLLGGTSLFQLVRVKDFDPNSSVAVFVASLFGSICALLVLIFTVWMPAEFGFPLIWSLGVSSGLYYSHFWIKSKNAQKPSRSSRR